MGRRTRLRARRAIGAVVDDAEDTMNRQPQTRAERTQAARKRASGHPTACTCGATPPTGNWFSVRNFADQPNKATIYIYQEIGYWGTTAAEFVQQLNEMPVDFLDVHINSPGGEVDDGVAIFNALRQHKAQVTVYIDGLAASAASFIALAGDRVCISQFAQLMIHDAMGIEFGNAHDMRTFADLLDRYSNNIAGIYSKKAGGPPEEWRERMRVETWFTGAEAVEAGLADDVYDAQPDDDGELMAAARWDLSLFAFRYQGRAAAPPPPLPTSQAEPAPEPQLVESTAEDTTLDTSAVAAPEASGDAEPVTSQEDVVEPDADTGAKEPEEEPEPDAVDVTASTEPDTTPEPDATGAPAASTNDDVVPWAELTSGLITAPDDVFTALKEGLLT